MYLSDVSPVLAVWFSVFCDFSHGPFQQSSHHVSFQSIQQPQQAFKQRALQRGQATQLYHPEALQHLLTK